VYPFFIQTVVASRSLQICIMRRRKRPHHDQVVFAQRAPASSWRMTPGFCRCFHTEKQIDAADGQRNQRRNQHHLPDLHAFSLWAFLRRLPPQPSAAVPRTVSSSALPQPGDSTGPQSGHWPARPLRPPPWLAPRPPLRCQPAFKLAQNSLDAPMNSEVNRAYAPPHLRRGGQLQPRCRGMITLIMSAAPAMASAARESQRLLESPNTIVAAPNTATHTNSRSPARLSKG